MRLSHNLASLNIYRNITKTEVRQGKALTKISSGKKLSRAADEPNKIAQSERFKLELRSMHSTSRNIQDGISMLQTTEGGLDQVSSSLIRIRELIVQGGSGSLTKGDREIILKEIKTMSINISYLAENTQFNEKSLLKNSEVVNNLEPEYIKTVIGTKVGETIEIPTFNFSKETLKLDEIKLDDDSDIQKSLGIVDDAIFCINRARSKLGGIENRLEDTYDNTQQVYNAFQKADSTISDADVGEESVEFWKNNVLLDAGNAILVQTNKLPMDVLNILQNMK